MAKGDSEIYESSFKPDPEREEALRSDLAKKPVIPPSEASFQKPLESSPPEEVEQTPEERFKQSFVELSGNLDKLVPFLPEEFKGRKTPPDFYLERFPEGMTKEDYESALLLVEDTVEAVRAGLEELEKSRGSLDGKEQRQKVVEIVKGVGGNVNSLLEDVKGKVSERKRLEEEAEYAKELGEERFEAGVGEKAKKAEERFEKFEEAPEKLERLRGEIENRYRLIGHREGMIKWLDDATKPAWEEDLEKIKGEVDDLFSEYLNHHIKYEREKSKARGEEVELDRDSVSEKLVASFSDAYEEGYDYGVAQEEKFPLPGQEVASEKGMELVEKKKMGLFDWLRNTKFGRFIKWTVIVAVAGPPLGVLGDYLGKRIGLEKPIREAYKVAEERSVDYRKHIDEEYQRIRKEIMEILGGRKAGEAPIEEISEKPAPIVAERAPEPTPTTKEIPRTEVKEEPIDKRRLILRDEEVIKKEDRFLDELLGKDFERTARFKEYNARFIWDILHGGALPSHSTREKLEKEYGPEYAALKRMAEELRPELEESARLGKLDQDKIYYLIELHTI